MLPQLPLLIHYIPAHLHLKIAATTSLSWCSRGDCAPTGRARGYTAGAKPEAQTGRVEGPRRAGIGVGAAGLLCGWEVMAMGREEPPRGHPLQTSAAARQAVRRRVLHQPCSIQPGSNQLPRGLVFETPLQWANVSVTFLKSVTWLLCIILGCTVLITATAVSLLIPDKSSHSVFWKCLQDLEAVV